jgi:hypothetical protein
MRGDDGAEHVGELGADDQEPLGVGLGRGDLQQRDQLAGGGQPVLDEAVVAELDQFLGADPVCRSTSTAAQAQNARSSSMARLRRLPVARSSAQMLAAAPLVVARASVCPAAVMTSPGLAARAACSRVDGEPFAGAGVHP